MPAHAAFALTWESLSACANATTHWENAFLPVGSVLECLLLSFSEAQIRPWAFVFDALDADLVELFVVVALL
ncbi:MAG: hypothetical protein KGL15_12110 [Acidobacteriota bacterium]|nr:hypothetical protein [Acidobacteriota bacterium]